ncbi:hypothetical protein MBLNU230_g4788t1 [Neophaeotheca triangularis]
MHQDSRQQANNYRPDVTSTDMPEERTNPLLQQTALRVNPFIDLPTAPTLPHNYASLPSTLPPSTLNAAPAASAPELPAYVTSSSGFAAHPSTIRAQNEALLKGIEDQKRAAAERVRSWEKGIEERELAEKRRKAPGWLDSEVKVLEPEKAKKEDEDRAGVNLMDEPEAGPGGQAQEQKSVDELGEAMDRAFGRT